MRFTITLILAIILALLVTIFAVQNNNPENIQFLAWKTNGSLALILMITFAIGILIGLLISAPAWFRRVRQSAELRKSIQGLEKNLEEARMAVVKPVSEKPGEASTDEMTSGEEPEQAISQDANKEEDA
jgi:putative membrane protein